jgi:hypothetical protein
MTLCERTTEAFREAYSEALLNGLPNPMHVAMGEVLAHVGGELLAMDAHHPEIKAHQAAYRFLEASRTLEVER